MPPSSALTYLTAASAPKVASGISCAPPWPLTQPMAIGDWLASALPALPLT
jgi:hypothetical protein